jgi:hypothetical protein
MRLSSVLIPINPRYGLVSEPCIPINTRFCRMLKGPGCAFETLIESFLLPSFPRQFSPACVGTLSLEPDTRCSIAQALAKGGWRVSCGAATRRSADRLSRMGASPAGRQPTALAKASVCSKFFEET